MMSELKRYLLRAIGGIQPTVLRDDYASPDCLELPGNPRVPMPVPNY